LVAAPVSSMNTSFSTSIACCASLQASRALARPRVLARWRAAFFLKVKLHLFNWCQRAPVLISIPCEPAVLAAAQESTQARRNPPAQGWLRILQSRTAMAADLKNCYAPRSLAPVPHLIDIETAELKALRDRRWPLSPSQGSKHTIPQILRIRLHPNLPLTHRRIIA